MTSRIAPAGPVEALLARLPDLLRCHVERREAVLSSGLLERELLQLCARYVAQDEDVLTHADDGARFSERERVALAWTHAALWSPETADDALWGRLHACFSEPELVQLFYFLQWEIGNRAWLTTLGMPPDAASVLAAPRP
jgi:hypothetical protein